MSKVKFYDDLPEMECIAGDTLPVFVVYVENENLTNCSMQAIVAKANAPTNAVICKEGTAIEGGFQVQLDSSDTSKLVEGAYILHFRLIGTDSLNYIKLRGSLYVRSAVSQ